MIGWLLDRCVPVTALRWGSLWDDTRDDWDDAPELTRPGDVYFHPLWWSACMPRISDFLPVLGAPRGAIEYQLPETF